MQTLANEFIFTANMKSFLIFFYAKAALYVYSTAPLYICIKKYINISILGNNDKVSKQSLLQQQQPIRNSFSAYLNQQLIFEK